MSDNDLTLKIDVLDLLIDVLKEHEKALDKSIEKLQDMIDEINKTRRKRGRYRPG